MRAQRAQRARESASSRAAAASSEPTMMRESNRKEASCAPGPSHGQEAARASLSSTQTSSKTPLVTPRHLESTQTRLLMPSAPARARSLPPWLPGAARGGTRRGSRGTGGVRVSARRTTGTRRGLRAGEGDERQRELERRTARGGGRGGRTLLLLQALVRGAHALGAVGRPPLGDGKDPGREELAQAGRERVGDEGGEGRESRGRRGGGGRGGGGEGEGEGKGRRRGARCAQAVGGRRGGRGGRGRAENRGLRGEGCGDLVDRAAGGADRREGERGHAWALERGGAEAAGRDLEEGDERGRRRRRAGSRLWLAGGEVCVCVCC